MRKYISCAMAMAAYGACGSLAGLPTVVFSNIVTSPTSDVPGMPGFKFYPNTLPPPQNGPVFDLPFGSPDGQRWIFRTWIRDTAGYHAIVSGSGPNGSAADVVVVAGTPTFFNNSVVYYFLRSRMAITDDGSFAFACDTTAPTNSDEIGARWTPESEFELIAREGTQAVGQPAGIRYVGAGYLNILADHRVAFLSGLQGSSDAAAFLNSSISSGAVLLQTGLTIPDDQAQPGTVLSSFGAFSIDATGLNHLYSGRLANGHDVVAVNNAVVAERDRPLPGGYPGFFRDVDLFDEGFSLSPYNGHYAFRCPADFDGNWDHVVVVDDRVAAATDTPITPGSAEVWRNGDNSNTPFLLSVVNSRGDYLIGGVAWLDQFHSYFALVFNGTTDLQYGGGVDMNGDGLPNDGYLAGAIRTDSAFLTDDGKLYFTAPLSNGFQFVGEAFLWLPVPRGGDTNCDGAIDFFDIDPFLLALFDQPAYTAAYPDCWHITADINRDGNVDFFDIDPFLECLFAICP